MESGEGQGILTLEPLIEAVRQGVERAGWEVSGFQKTTSYQFEGRWEGDSTRSAYLFFHLPSGPDAVSLDVFLDETSRGLSGNLALVLDGPALGALGDVPASLRRLADVARAGLSREYRTPLTLRLYLEGPDVDTASAETEVRFKVRIPRSAIAAGAEGVASMAHAAATRLRALLDSPDLAPHLEGG